MSGDDWNDDDWQDGEDEAAEDLIACPDCGADFYEESEACPECGYWLTEADRVAAWRARSSTGKVLRIGWWLIGLAIVGAAIALLA